MTGGPAGSLFDGHRLAEEPNIEVQVDGSGVVTMSNSVEVIAAKYLTKKKLSGVTPKEYKSTVTKWTAWGNGVDVDQINRSHIRPLENTPVSFCVVRERFTN